ncbi:hypothetical protein [Actinomycetospora chiangmaiensis]|uniref:hypothetical protein n=1 Tax=Actinomycetospora chiangmaiensis TaxID=402650 RepID=UPI0003726F2A|nr:hypothetical protein [Actinomycetospora chiangmaiensis]
MTKDRITNVLGVLGAIFCLVAVLTGFGHAPATDDNGNAAPAPPPTGQVAPAPAPPAAPTAQQDGNG